MKSEMYSAENPKPNTNTENQNKENSHETINTHVDGNITHLTLSALSSALGDIRVMKLQIKNKSSVQYTPVTDPQELVTALQYIAKFNNTHITPESLSKYEHDQSYFILQQSNINMSAWNSLVDRRLGKIPQEAKIDVTTTLDLETLGQKAVEARKRNSIDAIPTTAVPASWITPE